MECVVENAPPPMELRMGWQCERWRCLPKAGGLFDQDYQLMYRMSVLLNIHHTVTRVRSLKGKEIHRLTDAERKILRYLMDKEILFHA